MHGSLKLSAGILFISLILCLAPAYLFAFENAPTYVQALIGAAQFSENDLTFTETSSIDGTTTSETDLSDMPYLGIAFQHPLNGKDSPFGLDGALLFGWRSKDKSVVAGSGQVEIKLDSALWLADLSMGLYAKHTFGTRWRTYIAAGPAIVFGEYSEDVDDENLLTATTSETDSTDSEFGVGAYVRGGIDYRVQDDAYIGLCIRGLKTNIEFDSAPEASSGLSGAQAFISFARHF